MSSNQLKKQMRRRLCHQRQHLTPSRLKSASTQLCLLLQKTYFIKRAKKVGFYMAMGGELDALPLIEKILLKGKSAFVPILHPHKYHHLLFARIQANTKLKPNKYGILEPSLKNLSPCPSYLLDVVLVPLVGFDRAGHRLGMGGGYYDRTFHFKKKGHRPLLVGLAHEFQEQRAIPHDQRDIPLDIVVTPSEVITFHKNKPF